MMDRWDEDYNPYKPLLSRTVRKLYVSEGEGYLKFETEGEPIIFRADGDCCSETWFADIVNVEALLGQVVNSAVALPETNPGDDGRNRQEEDLVYGYQFDTGRGTCTIAFRNSSNGYYGGYITQVESDASELADVEFREVKEDFSA